MNKKLQLSLALSGLLVTTGVGIVMPLLVLRSGTLVAQTETYEELVKQFTAAVEAGDAKKLGPLSMKLARTKKPDAILLMIGAIDSDNTAATIHGIGFFGLAEATK